MPTESFRIESRRIERAKRVQTAQHVVAAVTLISGAWPHLREHITLLPALELLAGALLVGAAVRDRVRHRRGAHHEAVGWVEIAGAVMSFVEAFNRLRERHHLPIYILAFVQPIILLMFGLFDVRLAARRAITVDDHGIAMRVRLLFGRRVAWTELHAFRPLADRIEFVLAEGATKTFNLRQVINRDAAIAWTVDQLRRRGVDELPAA